MHANKGSPQTGYVELLLTIPLLFLIAWGSAMVSMRMHESGKLEHSTWNYAMSRAHKSSEDVSVNNAQSVFKNDQPTDLKISNDTPYLGMGLEAFHTAKSELPISFKVALLLYHTEQKKLCRQQSLDPRNVVAHLGATGLSAYDSPSEGFQGFDLTSNHGCDNEAPVFFKKEVETKIPGNDLKGKWLFKQAIQWEGMCSTNFKYPFLWAIGIPELVYIASGVDVRPETSLLCGSPTSAAPQVPGGSNFKDLLNSGQLKKFGSEVQGLAKNFSADGKGMDSSSFSKLADFGKGQLEKIFRKRLEDYGSAASSLKAAAGAAGVEMPSLNPDQFLTGIEEKVEETASEKLQGYVTKKIQEGIDAGEQYIDDRVEKYTAPIDNFNKEKNDDFIPTL